LQRDIELRREVEAKGPNGKGHVGVPAVLKYLHL